MKEIPILRIPFSDEDLLSLHDGWQQVLRSGFLTLGTYTSRFESLFRDFTGAKYAVAVSNGTSALEVIIRALGIEGKSIVVPTNTFLASALAVAHAGNNVIFADSDPSTLSLDPEDVVAKIRSDTAAVMVVHIGGIISPATEILREICERRGIHLIEDCAHAHGSTLGGKHAGLLGTAGGFSFFPTKTLTTGEGGMVITDDETVYKNSLMLRNQGKNPALGGHISEFGHNWRMSEITAVLGVQQMEKAPQILASRKRIADFYDAALGEFDGLRRVPLPPGNKSSYYKYIAYLEPGYERAQVKKVMREKYRVSLPGEVYADLCHNEPIWEKYAYCGKRRDHPVQVQCHRWPECGCDQRQQGFPGADYISNHHICLPMYPGLEHDDLAYVVESLDRTLHEDLPS
jgi:dTDP-4-amino-4,6-dideoxygalactose transaminase